MSRHYDRRLSFGFRMLDDDFGTEDADEIPIDFSDEDETEEAEEMAVFLMRFFVAV